ncbi:opalin-like isoform X2 [Lepisosteus oculatus]|uniref:opalin-like isoform X2 n=1 Tax=Lepisosteus oculatus TaxID=7918 RepID=UPI0037127FF0
MCGRSNLLFILLSFYNFKMTTQDTVVFLLTGNTTSSPNVTSELPSTSPTPAIVLLPPEKENCNLAIGLAAGFPSFVALCLLVALIALLVLKKKRNAKVPQQTCVVSQKSFEDHESTREDNRYETLQFGKNQDEVYYNMTCTSTNRSSSTIPPAQRPLPRPPGQSEGSYSMHLPGTYSNHAAIKNYR